MESFDYIPYTCEDILSEMLTYVLLADEDTLVISDDINNNNHCKGTVNNNQDKQNILEKIKSEDGSCRTNLFRAECVRCPWLLAET